MRGALPDFLIVGAQKAGTTSLWHNLSRHPQIHMARHGDAGGQREVHFFDREDHWARGIEWYRSFFPETQCVQGEKTPEYMALPKARERMARIVPRAKLVILLRNPVTRAHSHWNHLRENEGLLEDFGEAVDAACRAVPGPFELLLTRGDYLEQIRSLLRLFPREQLYIAIAERFRADAVSEYNRVLRFLECDPSATGYESVHVRGYPAPMEARVGAMLADHYAESVEALRAFLGDEIPEWQPREASRLVRAWQRIGSATWRRGRGS
ncbi:MAG: hypothetical protein CL938_00175 [Deltaproteobacteria bacterium]|jgi:hypothetical protein|nr:hypothetical protein [Deltaproteobacteria bacterium]